MKLLGGLLISISLALGTIAALTAYVPKVNSIDPADGLRLAAPAGVHQEDPHAPLLDPGAGPVVLTAKALAQLSEAGVQRVRVKSFALKRWSHRYLFLFSCAGLAVGAFLVRRANRRRVSAAVDSPETASPEELLQSALGRVESLREAIADADSTAARKEIVETLDDLVRTEFDAFVQARPLVIGRLGMAGYARVMDRFAAAERQLNRAWSAAADHVLEESRECLAEGQLRLQETLQRLGTDGRSP